MVSSPAKCRRVDLLDDLVVKLAAVAAGQPLGDQHPELLGPAPDRVGGVVGDGHGEKRAHALRLQGGEQETDLAAVGSPEDVDGLDAQMIEQRGQVRDVAGEVGRSGPRAEKLTA